MVMSGELQKIMSFRIVKAAPCMEGMRLKEAGPEGRSWRIERDTSESELYAQRSGSDEAR